MTLEPNTFRLTGSIRLQANSASCIASPISSTILPGYEVDRHRYMLDHDWARLALVGPEYPNVFDNVDPVAMRRSAVLALEATQVLLGPHDGE